MDVGIGLPAAIPGVTGDELLEWARRADAAGFSSLGMLDRIVYANYEPLIALAAAASVTQRIRLTTDILLLPPRANAALVAKQALTVHHLSGGRLVLGTSPGGRPDDFEASGVPFNRRGSLFEEMLEQVKRVWAGEEFGFAGAIGPEPPERPPELLIGGSTDRAFRRAAEYGDGWTMGGGTAERFAEGLEKLKAEWSRKGRAGQPRTMALAYFGLGDDAEKEARSDLAHYYAWLGEELAEMIVGGAATDEQTVNSYIRSFAEAGADELILFPVSTDPEQVDLLARVALAGSSVHP
jgi:alkanesulfonate monooxygenase SsuD/methylene tetrahydromethanopterin reductase-like flavin-dependent oxidoreductase (luciferase family)